MPAARLAALVRSGVLAWWPLVWPDMLAGLELLGEAGMAALKKGFHARMATRAQ